ncbi:MAG: hypothetical protein JNK09_07650 [Prolixibacteraceae bacterium]|nr:hypothetical protein [Prolixibacteraceae bacterium]
MNKTQTKDVRMFVATDECLNQNQSKWAAINAITNARNKLNANITTIKNFDQQKASSLSNPVTSNKEKVKEQLEHKISVLAGIVASYAAANNLKEISEKVKLLSKGFSKKRETDIEPNVKSFLVLVNELMPYLGDYAITNDMVNDAQNALTQFIGLVGVPRTMRVKNSSAKKEMDDLIGETKRLLSEQMDNLMLRFKLTDSEFFNSYTKARAIVDTGVRHREKPEEPQTPV